MKNGFAPENKPCESLVERKEDSDQDGRSHTTDLVNNSSSDNSSSAQSQLIAHTTNNPCYPDSASHRPRHEEHESSSSNSNKFPGHSSQQAARAGNETNELQNPFPRMKLLNY